MINRRMNAKSYLEIIRCYGLTHASSRALPLLSVSCLFEGYTCVLKQTAGYSYNIGAIGENNKTRFLINEDKIGELFGKRVRTGGLPVLIKRMRRDFLQNKQQVARARKEKNNFKGLVMILDIYPQIFSQIGLYNSAMRYVQNNQDKAKKLGYPASLIGKNKDMVANLLYSVIEPFIKKCVDAIGKKSHFNGDLLRYMTMAEFRSYLKKPSLSLKQILDLKRRKNGYLYLLAGGEYLTFRKEIISRVDKELTKPEENTAVIKGVAVYPGKAIGRVYKAFHGVKVSKPGYVLVTNITKPDDVPFLRKFAAIVTDEGGLLSHVAVVAREFKIPSIMSAKIATKVLKDGDLVEVDADHGTVKILNNK